MKELRIEWRHYAKDGATCDRCAATGSSVAQVVGDLQQELSRRGITVIFSETLLPAERMAESNMVLFNGIPLEELLADTKARESECPSCSCLTGTATSCRAIEHAGVSHEEIPAELIRTAALLATNLTID